MALLHKMAGAHIGWGGWLFNGKQALVDVKLALRYGAQEVRPVPLGRSSNGRWYWAWKDSFYWEEEGLEANQVQALLEQQQARRDSTIARATAARRIPEPRVHRPGSPVRRSGSYIPPASEPASRERVGRASISDKVKINVWNRDAGVCVRCGSNRNLEYDHIIPIAMGGANTERNLQLLCEPCNRSKGANLA